MEKIFKTFFYWFKVTFLKSEYWFLFFSTTSNNSLQLFEDFVNIPQKSEINLTDLSAESLTEVKEKTKAFNSWNPESNSQFWISLAKDVFMKNFISIVLQKANFPKNSLKH